MLHEEQTRHDPEHTERLIGKARHKRHPSLPVQGTSPDLPALHDAPTRPFPERAAAVREPRRTHCLETVLGPCSVLENRLNLDGELDLVAHQHASGLQRLVPGEAEVPAVDAAAGAEADALATPRVLPASLVDHVEGHLASHVLDREIAHQLELIARGCERPAYGTAPEADGRILL